MPDTKANLQQLRGLTTEEAQQLLLKYGHNSSAEKPPHLILTFIRKFWAPIPWMLEVTIILQVLIGKTEEALIILGLLIFNSLLSFLQEERANKAFALLRKQLAIKARVLRDKVWQLILAEDLVPGDVVYLRMGDIVPADIRLIHGNLLLDQSALTGESLPVESSTAVMVYAGSLVKRGEASGSVIATGNHTYFGKTAELVKTAETPSHIKSIIFTIVKYLIAINSILTLGVFVFALFTKQPLLDVIPFILILLVSAIPAALPATFTLATTLGAHHLTAKGVLVTRLSAIEEAAVMDTVCLDKTGTITRNQLQLATLVHYPPYSQDDLLKFALLASDEATQDPIDMAIFNSAAAEKLHAALPPRLSFFPFDPARKRTEVIFELDGKRMHVLKGSPEIIADIIGKPNGLFADAVKLAAQGYRLIAVVVNTIGADNSIGEFKLVGVLAFYDPPREDSKALITNLKSLGLRPQMVTGDGLITAKVIAEQVGIGNVACNQAILHQSTNNQVFSCDVFAGVFPEDKFLLVKALQQLGHTTGMTGDGVNDAPSLRQAEVGIAVANATDVAKASASIILTNSGLSGIIAAVESSRRIHKRMLTYILNKITKSFEVAVFLCLGIMWTHSLIITPTLMIFLLFTSDFVTMSIATDRVPFSPKPEKWKIANLMFGAGILASLILVLSFTVFFLGRNYLHLPLPQLQTLTFLLLAFTGQGNVYLVRERQHIWHSLPGHWLILSSIFGIVVVSSCAVFGIFMTAIQPILVIMLLGTVVLYLIAVDCLKVQVFKHFEII